MNPIESLCGIVTVLNTPFNTDDSLDLAGLEQNVRYAAQAGVKGFLAPAMASEVYALRPEERKAILACVRKAAPDLALIGGASAPTHDECMAHARECVAAGCDGVLVSIGAEHAAELATRLQDLATLNPGFIMLQDWDAEGDGMPDDILLDAFNSVDAFKCVKIEVAEAGAKYTRLLDKTKGELHVSGGWAVTQMLDGLKRGVHAFMPTGMHATYSRIYSLYTEGKEEEAAELFEDLSPILEFSNQDLEGSILFFKQLLHAQGIYATDKVRDPIEAWEDEEQEIALEMVEEAMSLENESLAALGLEALKGAEQ